MNREVYLHHERVRFAHPLPPAGALDRGARWMARLPVLAVAAFLLWLAWQLWPLILGDLRSITDGILAGIGR